MKRYASPSSSCRSPQQVQDLRLDRDVERRDRLVADDQARLDGERARDADALALPAGELVRVALTSWLGIELHALAAARPRARCARRRPRRSRRTRMPSAIARARACAGRARPAGPGRRSGCAAGTARSSPRREAEQVHALEADRALLRLDRGAGSSDRRWSCRSPTRRPARASRPPRSRGRRRPRRAPSPSCAASVPRGSGTRCAGPRRAEQASPVARSRACLLRGDRRGTHDPVPRAPSDVAPGGIARRRARSSAGSASRSGSPSGHWSGRRHDAGDLGAGARPAASAAGIERSRPWV